MSVQRARDVLSILWVMVSGPLVLFLIARSVSGYYGHEPEKIIDLWSWVFQFLFPVLGIIVAAWSVGAVRSQKKSIHSMPVFWGALILSVFYLFALWLVVVLEPFSEAQWSAVFRNSGIYLGPVQGIVVTALGKFFIENVH